MLSATIMMLLVLHSSKLNLLVRAIALRGMYESLIFFPAYQKQDILQVAPSHGSAERA